MWTQHGPASEDPPGPLCQILDQLPRMLRLWSPLVDVWESLALIILQGCLLLWCADMMPPSSTLKPSFMHLFGGAGRGQSQEKHLPFCHLQEVKCGQSLPDEDFSGLSPLASGGTLPKNCLMRFT